MFPVTAFPKLQIGNIVLVQRNTFLLYLLLQYMISLYKILQRGNLSATLTVRVYTVLLKILSK